MFKLLCKYIYFSIITYRIALKGNMDVIEIKLIKNHDVEQESPKLMSITSGLV